MYCSSCGVAITQGLSYCNRCGARIAPSDSVAKPVQASPEHLVAAIVTLFLGGMAGIIGLIAVMKKFDFNEGLINGFSATVFLLMLVLEGVILRLLLAPKRDGKAVSDTRPLRQLEIEGTGAAGPRALAQPQPSVTEHTTHTLKPIHTDRGESRE